MNKIRIITLLSLISHGYVNAQEQMGTNEIHSTIPSLGRSAELAARIPFDLPQRVRNMTPIPANMLVLWQQDRKHQEEVMATMQLEPSTKEQADMMDNAERTKARIRALRQMEVSQPGELARLRLAVCREGHNQHREMAKLAARNADRLTEEVLERRREVQKSEPESNAEPIIVKIKEE